MGWMTGQRFVESVDGVRTMFTTALAFERGTIQIFQGSLAVEPEAVLEISSQSVRFLDKDSRQTWTIDDITPNTCYCAEHGLTTDTIVTIWSSDDTGLPSELERGGIYYVQVVDTDHIQFALTAGGDIVTFTASSIGTLYIAQPDAPIAIDGTLYYNAYTEGTTGEEEELIGFWTSATFQIQYAASTSLLVIEDVLRDADELLQAYVTVDSYTTAGTGVTPYRLFRRVQAELSLRLLQNRPNQLLSVTSSEKEYADNVKRMKQTYNGSISGILSQSLEDILSQLYAYKRPEASSESTVSAYLDCWGTGRFFGLQSEATSDPIIVYP